jgi:3-methyladenine DNA glycosylase/8-oxoguanine DNA glycosylase
VDGRRSGTLLRAAAAAERLEQAAGMAAGPARARLEAVPGVGGWTSAEVAHTALGDPDAVSFGDFHVARDVGFALTGHPTDDAGMADLLAPYLGHRYRVQRLVELAGIRAPRRGPRRALRAWPPP